MRCFLSALVCTLVFVSTAAVRPIEAQGKSVLVVNAFTTGKDVNLPYDMKQLQAALVAELKVELAKSFDVAAEAPSGAQGTVYTLDGEITKWESGNAAKRVLVGFGSGRESSDIQFRVTDGSGKKVVDKEETIRTNFYSQGAGSTGTLAHPIAQKIADRIKDAKLK